MLQLRDISKRYGSLQVIDHLSLDLAAGEALGVIGPNGAGKTTLFSIIAGQVTPAAAMSAGKRRTSVARQAWGAPSRCRAHLLA